MAKGPTRFSETVGHILYSVAFIGFLLVLAIYAVSEFFGIRLSTTLLETGLFSIGAIIVVLAVVLVVHGFSEGLGGKASSATTSSRWATWSVLGAGFVWLFVQAAIVFLIILGLFAASGFAFANRQWALGTGLLSLTVFIVFAVFREYRKIRANIQSGMQSELRRINCCPHCEYDLRGSSLRCPECGKAVETAASANVEI